MDAIGPSGVKWAQRFEKYDRENPQVWELFKKFTLQSLKAGYRRVSANLILYRVRFETMVQTVGDPWKVNSAYGPSYARKFMSEFPQYDGVFETRVRGV